MRQIIALVVLLTLAGCASSPQALGITGPGSQAMPAGPSLPTDSYQDTNGTAGVPTTGSFYGPNNGPTAGSSGYYGYN